MVTPFDCPTRKYFIKAKLFNFPSFLFRIDNTKSVIMVREIFRRNTWIDHKSLQFVRLDHWFYILLSMKIICIIQLFSKGCFKIHRRRKWMHNARKEKTKLWMQTPNESTKCERRNKMQLHQLLQTSRRRIAKAIANICHWTIALNQTDLKEKMICEKTTPNRTIIETEDTDQNLRMKQWSGAWRRQHRTNVKEQRTHRSKV